MSLGFLFYRVTELPVVVASVFFATICYIDTRTAKIPNIANASLAIVGLALNFYMSGMKGLAFSGLGLAAGLGLLIVPYLMGGFGAGDVKALTALGTLVGPKAILQIFVYMALIGGIFAILHYVSNRNLKEQIGRWWLSLKVAAMTSDPRQLKPGENEPLRFPYAAAIALGYYTWLIRGDVL